MARSLELHSTSRRILAGWLLLALAAVTLGAAPALQLSTAYPPARGLQAFKLILEAHALFVLLIMVPSLVAALGVFAGGRMAEGDLYSPLLGRCALGLSAAGSMPLLASLLACSCNTLFLTDLTSVLNIPPFFAVGYALFAVGVLATVAKSLVAVGWRRQASILIMVDPRSESQEVG